MGIRGSWLCSFVCLMDTQPCADGGGVSGAGRATATSFWFLGLLGLISALLPSPACIVSSNLYKTTLQLCLSKTVPLYQNPNCSVPQGGVIEIGRYFAAAEVSHLNPRIYKIHTYLPVGFILRNCFPTSTLHKESKPESRPHGTAAAFPARWSSTQFPLLSEGAQPPIFQFISNCSECPSSFSSRKSFGVSPFAKKWLNLNKAREKKTRYWNLLFGVLIWVRECLCFLCDCECSVLHAYWNSSIYTTGRSNF